MTPKLKILQSGILSLIQDEGRFGQHSVGLTSGGPLDPLAFKWANRLVSNAENATAIEVTVGGLKLSSLCDTFIAVTGAKVDVKINGKLQAQWQTLTLKKEDVLELGYATQGCRIYIAFASGLNVPQQFNSNSTVIREGIGGLNGQALQQGDELPLFNETKALARYQLPEKDRPEYLDLVTLRVIPGYQEHHFSRHEQRMFFYHEYTVSDLCDRMGYRLAGPKVQCDIGGILSEGICLGAVQIPKDGQPIVLMNDRQTIGGYPKIGSVLSLDLAKLAQLGPGGKVKFEPMTIDHAHNVLTLAHYKYGNQRLVTV